MNFLQRNPFFRLLLPLIAGIVAFRLISVGVYFYAILSSLAFLLIITSLLIKNTSVQYKFRWFFGAGVYLLIFQLAFFLLSQREKKLQFEPMNQKGIFEVKITESPVIKENSVLCRIKVKSFFSTDSGHLAAKGKALIYIAKDSSSVLLRSGDLLLIQSVFKKPDGIVNPNGFDYATYLSRQGISATSFISKDSWVKTGTDKNFSIIRTAEHLQHKLLDVYRRFEIKGDEYAVLAALTLGSKDALHPELRQNYTTSGGMHILAVSGLHVGVIYLVLNFLIQFFDRKHKFKLLKSIVIIILLWLYALITGLPPSVIRSTLMFSLVALGTGLERKSQIFNTISMAAFIMLIINPDFLYDVGFELSFSAVIAIVYFQPKIAKWLVFKNKILRWAWDLTAVSLAAQVGTAALSIYYFHQFPNYFLITNFIAIPFATFIIYTAVALYICSPIPYVSTFIAFILNKMLLILNISIGSIHHIPFSLTKTPINGLQLLITISTIILISFYLHNKRFKPLITGLCLILVFCCINIFIEYKSLNTKKVIVFSDNRNTHINFQNNKKNYVFTTDSVSLHKVIDNYIIQNKLSSPQKITECQFYNDGFAVFHNKRFMIITDNQLKGKTTGKKLFVDYLIIGNKIKPAISGILDCISPKKIIVDKSISEWYTNKIKIMCRQKNIAFYSVAESGAFVLEMKD